MIKTKKLNEIHRWCKKNLPIDNSLVALELILFVTEQHESSNQITIKHLFSSLEHSYTGLRHHYKRLIDDGWLEHDEDRGDKRIK